MTKISDLPLDLAEEVLSRIPVTSLRAIRFTCKNWNSITKHGSFTKKQIDKAKAKKKQEKEFEVIITMNFKVYLMSVNLDVIHKDDKVESSIKQKGKLISLDGADVLVIQFRVFHCSGLLLCITRDKSRLVIWNPYTGQTRWIQPRNSYESGDMYALGYEMKNKSHRTHKILRFKAYDMSLNPPMSEFEIYNLNSNSWKVVDVTPDWIIRSYQRGMSLKGNTYWFAREKIPHAQGERPCFLLCFDFTREKFGPRLPLPFHYHIHDTVTLSTVREEQIAVLFQHGEWTEIWISNKIEPNAVSWNKLFLAVGTMRLAPGAAATFFVDQEKKFAVVFDKAKNVVEPTRHTAYILVGEDGCIKQVDLGVSLHRYCFPLVCSYVPSSVQI